MTGNPEKNVFAEEIPVEPVEAELKNPTDEEFEKNMAAIAAGITIPTQAAQKDNSEEIARLEDQLMRTLAEMQNLRKRTEKEVEEARKFAVASFATDLIGVLENLRRAEESIPKETAENALFKNIGEGVKLTAEEFLRVLTRHGVKRIDPLGEKFDHNYHQAMIEIPDAEHAPGVIVQVMQAGYVLKDRLLRPALVGIAKAVDDKVEG